MAVEHSVLRVAAVPKAGTVLRRGMRGFVYFPRTFPIDCGQWVAMEGRKGSDLQHTRFVRVPGIKLPLGRLTRPKMIEGEI